MNLPNIPLGNSTPVPTSLTITAPTTTLTSAGQAVQLTVTATYPTGPSQDVTNSTTGTAYTISNTAIATISPNGLVTAVRSGTVVVQAINEGRSAVSSFNVAFTGGVDTDGDGIPDDAELRLGLNPNDPTDALLDLDHDGLNNLQEYLLGTDIRNPDTDGDGINDGDEVNATGLACTSTGQCFHTNPLLPDTDGDGIWDLTEIQTGSDPTNPNSINLHGALTGITVSPTNFTLIVNSLNGTASVQLTVTGNLIDHRTIDLTSTTRGTNYLSSDLTICNFGSPDGRVFAGNAGSCTITVSNNGFAATVTGAVTNFTPLSLSFVSVPGFANAVAVSGDYAFVAAGASGLQVVGLSSDRMSPVVVGSLALAGNANDIKLLGTTAYVVTSTSLHVIDITNPLVPVLRGTFATGGMGVAVAGTTAYLVGGGGLVLVNVSNPSAMIQISSLSLNGTLWKVTVDSSRNLAAVAAGSSGLELIDVTNPAAPVLRGAAATGDARAVALNGNWAYVGDYTTSTNSVDITSLTAPVVRSNITDPNLGGFLQDIVVAGNFALAADVKFVNGIPITDITDPTNLVARAILNFPQRDDNGMGIAIDASFAYVVTEHSSLERGGTSGDSRLYIGQFLPLQDLGGVPPTAAITAPANGSTQYEGAQLTVSVNATDDVAVASVAFLINGQVAFTSTSTPYQYTFAVPVGVNSLTLGAKATDLGGNVGTAANVVVNVVPDPLTLVTGLVTDQTSAPVSGATATAPGGLTATTGADGRFSIPGVPTIFGNIQVNATFTPAGGTTLSGSSVAVPPVLAGVTDVGTIQLIPATFITDYGAEIPKCDDCSYQYNLPFTFNFYGTAFTSAFVGTNGYVTFNAGDNTYVESLTEFNSLPRISGFFDDLFSPGSSDPSAGLYVNSSIPGLFLVTYLNDPHYPPYENGPNTLQIQMYSDGRIVFAYHGISNLDTGTIVGLTPGPGSPAQALDYITQPNVDIPAGTAVYEYFNDTSLFNLDSSFIVYTPNPGGGYNVRTITPPPPQPINVLMGAPPAPSPGKHPTGADLAKAEVIVRSSTNHRYIGMTNADKHGNFVLNGVPAGGVDVVVRRKGRILAQGAGIFPGGPLGTKQVLQILLASPQAPPKKKPNGK
jgi:hypothetical protein